MITLLTQKYRRQIAWFLLFLFYGDVVTGLHAATVVYKINTNRLNSYYGGVTSAAGKIHKVFNTSNDNRPFIPLKNKSANFLDRLDKKKPDSVNIGGPGQPEMSRFKSVGANDMVNLFTGDFSYNIPLLDVGGYPVNLFYNGGVTMDQEASWVGLGWNINPGTIDRNMRGLPDDFDGIDVVKKVESIKPDVTVGVTGGLGVEFMGTPFSASVNAGIYHNTRRGLGLQAGIQGEFSIQKMLAMTVLDEDTHKDTVQNFKVPKIGLSGGIEINSQSGMTLDAGFKVYEYDKQTQMKYGLGTSAEYNSRIGMTDLKIDGQLSHYKAVLDNNCQYQLNQGSPFAGSVGINFARSSFTPSIRMPMTDYNAWYSLKVGGEEKPVFWNTSLTAYVQRSYIAPQDTVQEKPAYGFMYYQDANDDKNALMDFNRLNDGTYTYKTPVIAIPNYTYDVFTISGEGTGGSFRGYRSNIGYIRDHDAKTKAETIKLSGELGLGDVVHAGGTIGGVYSYTTVGEWKSLNALRQVAKFQQQPEGRKSQTFYFKNPGEKSTIDEDYYNSVGGDQLIRPYLVNVKSPAATLASGFQIFGSDLKLSETKAATFSTARIERDKRTQVISYLTAEEADRIGLDKKIYSYTENVFFPGMCPGKDARIAINRYDVNNPQFYRKRHHLSEIDVVEGDGRRYVYGLPVYQIIQKEVSFSTQGEATDEQKVHYDLPDNSSNGDDVRDNSVFNIKGRDHFYQREEIGGYAHSFLLTGILSPDYVDVKDDGITDDDLGTAVKFNYSRVNRVSQVITLPFNLQLPINTWRGYKWRVPMDANYATYNEGLKTDVKDDKGLYTYGEKELWYLHSIESKTMVATFRINEFDNERSDGKSVKDENGGPSSTKYGLRRLERIDLYTKADYLKAINSESTPRPIKTVHFQYRYDLCPNYPLNNNEPVYENGSSEDVNQRKGKLTLVAIWFSYNGNDNQVKNKYVFQYPEPETAENPSYHSAEADRWGNYKPHDQNPESVGNNDFPYVLQDKVPETNSYASAWNLKKILLPGGAVINIDYEADDYAYVQDRRAAQMTKIVGFGKEATSTPDNQLYDDYDSRIQATFENPALVDRRFVFFDSPDPLNGPEDIETKYLQGMKQLLLKLWVKMPPDNPGSMIGVGYEPVNIYGVIASYGVTSDPHRFYVELEETKKQGSPIMETIMQFLKDHLPGKAFPGYDVGGSSGLVQLTRATYGMMNAFREAVLGFERNFKKNRKCKEVQLSMSFARLNNPSFKKLGGGYRVKQITIEDNWDRMTGQYKSTYGQTYDYTTTTKIDDQDIVISSGVASYEPGIGNEENPFREVLKYTEKQFLGPTSHDNIEFPLAETFFPTPMVGYSKVTVRSIHNKDNKNLKSGIGLQQTEFYTTKDFPVITDYTAFDNTSRSQYKGDIISKVFKFNTKDYLTLTQGVRVVLNDMNGKLKSQTSYPENDLSTPINYTAYHYRMKSTGDNKNELDNSVRAVDGPNGETNTRLIGKDVEVMNDFREHFSWTRSGQIPINSDMFTLGILPIILPSIFHAAFRNESLFRSATTLKIVNEYGILDSVVNVDKGSIVTTKNLVYDQETGGVLVSRTNNEFDSAVYQFNYPAWWAYSGMGPAYKNIDVTYRNVLFRNGRIEESPQVLMSDFESGDEIYVVDNSTTPVKQSAACVGLGDPLTLPLSDQYRIWALDITKDSRNDPGDKEFIFLDRNGTPYNAANATIRIVRSGKRNFLDASVGSLVSLKAPFNDDTTQLVINDATDIINTGAVEYKEKWRANDMFYAVTDFSDVTHQAPLLELPFSPTQAASMMHYRHKTTGLFSHWQDDYNLYLSPDNDFILAKTYDNKKKELESRGWLLFDLNDIDASKTIVSAKLSLPSHQDINSDQLSPQGRRQHIMDPVSDNGQQLHDFSNPHYGNTKFFIQRLLTSWPDNFEAWKSILNSEFVGDASTQKAAGPTATPFNLNLNDLSYCDHCDPNAGGDNRLDVTNMVKAMIRDRDDPAKQLTTALQIEIANPELDKSLRRVCFANGFYSSKGLPIPPVLTIQYYNPSQEYGLEGNPESPPPGQEVFTWTTRELTTSCVSVFTKEQMNPYIEGVLGNWRPWKNYLFYNNRREKDFSDPSTNISKNGVIEDFNPFWTLGGDQITKTDFAPGISKWIWKSETTQYNRKGAELENRDTLQRYNAGIYGYSESLPIAVINNSQVRLAAFDGFEDYGYRDNEFCDATCKLDHRHFTTDITSDALTTSQAHTGKYSMQVPASENYTINVNVSDNDKESTPDIKVELNQTPYEDAVIVNPKGIGLQGNYYNNPSFLGTPVSRPDLGVNLSFRSKNDGSCKKHDDDDPPSDIDCENISVIWRGKLQVTTTGYYDFDIPNGIDDEGYLYLDNDPNAVVIHILGGAHTNRSFYLTAGTLHEIEVKYVQHTGTGQIGLVWKPPGASGFTGIPTINLYPEGQESLADGSTQTQTIYCVKPGTVQAIDHQLIDGFKLIPNQKMIMSVWIRKGTEDCRCAAYDNVSINVLDADDNSFATLSPKGPIIEGWQQFETNFTVPSSGDKIKLSFNGPADAELYFDDLRLHPFNANMKSFVYDPVTLRLTAELDENNFASFYEYDDDGTLVRTKKETVRGIKTIAETRSAEQKSIKDF